VNFTCYLETWFIIFYSQYRARDAPRYHLGHGIVLAYIAIGFMCTAIFGFLLQKENARRDRGERNEIIEGEGNEHADEVNGRYESVAAARIDKGDEWSGFRYVSSLTVAKVLVVVYIVRIS
jgi:hypothetical protein